MGTQDGEGVNNAVSELQFVVMVLWLDVTWDS